MSPPWEPVASLVIPRLSYAASPALRGKLRGKLRGSFRVRALLRLKAGEFGEELLPLGRPPPLDRGLRSAGAGESPVDEVFHRAVLGRCAPRLRPGVLAPRRW